MPLSSREMLNQITGQIRIVRSLKPTLWVGWSIRIEDFAMDPFNPFSTDPTLKSDILQILCHVSTARRYD